MSANSLYCLFRHLAYMRYFNASVSGGFRAGSVSSARSSVEPPLKSELFFMGNSEKMLAKWSTRTLSAKLNPLFKISGSAPDQLGYDYKLMAKWAGIFQTL